jgi:uncharacterized damage-inducible protein DinB
MQIEGAASSPASGWVQQLMETWRTNNRINLFLIDRISDAGMKCTLSQHGGRNVVRQFCHIHNARVWHLENRARDLSKGLYKFETHEEPGKSRLKDCLSASAKQIEVFLKEAAGGLPRRRTLKKGVIAGLGYLIAHESHHRGSILLTLKQCGHKVDAETGWAIWEWDKM